VDRERGGFRHHFLEDWSSGDDRQKTLVFQSRMTWVAAQVGRRYPDLAAEYLGYARHGLDFLSTVMWDGACGGFFWRLDEAGAAGEHDPAEKHVYGIAFAIYAAAAAYDATRDTGALDLAVRAFSWLEQNAHDGEHGGYLEALTRAGEPILAPAEARPGNPARMFDSIGTLYGYKSANTCLHLLEALTALLRVRPDALVEARLREMSALVRDRVAAEPGCLSSYLTRDWRPVPEHSSFGHDVEAAHLLLEADRALNREEDATTLAVARRLVDHAIEWGWDTTYGGFFEKGSAFKPAFGLRKIWWVQAEALNALLLMHERFSGTTRKYLDYFLEQWRFIRDHQVDRQYGEWHAEVSRRGTARPGQAKGTAWKAAYHNGRALMEVAERLRRLD
jgi:mannobiose 2-epimerase